MVRFMSESNNLKKNTNSILVFEKMASMRELYMLISITVLFITISFAVRYFLTWWT